MRLTKIIHKNDTHKIDPQKGLRKKIHKMRLTKMVHKIETHKNDSQNDTHKKSTK